MVPSDPASPVEGTVDGRARAAEEEAAAAEARAAEARTRAEELRRELATHTAIDGEAAAELQGETPIEDAPRQPHPLGQTLAAALAAVLTAGMLAATGYMLWQHRDADQQRQRAAEFAAAGRQGVINLMSIDYANAAESVQRVLDGSTGQFRSNFAETAEDFAKALQDEKIVTTATVNDAAVESMTDDSAVVLVSATSRREGPESPKDQQEPRLWRVVLTLERDGGLIKMSGVEFV